MQREQLPSQNMHHNKIHVQIHPNAHSEQIIKMTSYATQRRLKFTEIMPRGQQRNSKLSFHSRQNTTPRANSK